MNKSELLAQLRDAADELPRSNPNGIGGGGTYRAASAFIDQMEALTEPEIRMVIGMRSKSIEAGEFRDWLKSLSV